MEQLETALPYKASNYVNPEQVTKIRIIRDSDRKVMNSHITPINSTS